MIREIILHGKLKDQFDGPFFLDVETPVEAIRALCSQLKGFEKSFSGGWYQLVRGDQLMEPNTDHLNIPFGQDKEFHIVPCIAGAKRGGLGKAILGIAMIGVGFYTGFSTTAFTAFGTEVTFGKIALTGAALVFGGVSQLLTPPIKTPNVADRERPDQRPSFLYDGPVNTSREGSALPLVYGEAYAGSLQVSVQIKTEDF